MASSGLDLRCVIHGRVEFHPFVVGCQRLFVYPFAPSILTILANAKFVKLHRALAMSPWPWYSQLMKFSGELFVLVPLMATAAGVCVSARLYGSATTLSLLTLWVMVLFASGVYGQ